MNFELNPAQYSNFKPGPQILDLYDNQLAAAAGLVKQDMANEATRQVNFTNMINSLIKETNDAYQGSKNREAEEILQREEQKALDARMEAKQDKMLEREREIQQMKIDADIESARIARADTNKKEERDFTTYQKIVDNLDNISEKAEDYDTAARSQIDYLRNNLIRYPKNINLRSMAGRVTGLTEEGLDDFTEGRVSYDDIMANSPHFNRLKTNIETIQLQRAANLNKTIAQANEAQTNANVAANELADFQKRKDEGVKFLNDIESSEGDNSFEAAIIRRREPISNTNKYIEKKIDHDTSLGAVTKMATSLKMTTDAFKGIKEAGGSLMDVELVGTRETWDSIATKYLTSEGDPKREAQFVKDLQSMIKVDRNNGRVPRELADRFENQIRIGLAQLKSGIPGYLRANGQVGTLTDKDFLIGLGQFILYGTTGELFTENHRQGVANFYSQLYSNAIYYENYEDAKHFKSALEDLGFYLDESGNALSNGYQELPGNSVERNYEVDPTEEETQYFSNKLDVL